MKRKQLYKTGILFLLLAGITYSCNLEENIYNQIAEDKVFQSEADILPFIAPGYSQLRRTL